MPKHYPIITVHYSTNTTNSTFILSPHALIIAHCQYYNTFSLLSGLVPFVLIFGLNIATYRKICQMQRENFEMRRGSLHQREHEIKLSQISLAIAAGM